MFNYFFGFFQSEQNYPLNRERKEEVKKLVDDLLLTTVNRMAERIESETNLKNSSIRKISNTKYRVLIGPFNDIEMLEKSYNVIKSLNFENLEILRNV